MGAILIVGAIAAILIGVCLWKKGNQDEAFWQALLDVIGDILIIHLPVFLTFRAWAVFLWLIGSGILIIAIWVIINRML